MKKVTPIAAASARVHAGNSYGAWRKLAERLSAGAFRKGRRGFVSGLAALSAAPVLNVLPTSTPTVISAGVDVGADRLEVFVGRLDDLNRYEFAEFEAAYVRAIALSMAAPYEALSRDYCGTHYAKART